jgi:5-methyltetrahydropteroyltriglutamate--homocysteine methyltransferase
VAPSCSLLHVPVDTDQEHWRDGEIRPWLSFAVQKVEEIATLRRGLTDGRDAIAPALALSRQVVEARRQSARVHLDDVQGRVLQLSDSDAHRRSPYASRIQKQKARLNLPPLPTTTIGSFPQTPEIRKARAALKQRVIGRSAYDEAMRTEIRDNVARQESLGLDVLVHGEPERNDMVEYFGEQLWGVYVTEHGWVQSYGSRCVKPPIIYGDVARQGPMTLEWARYAQSLTHKPVKGMLTGPNTILQWSFVRNDVPRETIALQIALALRDEVHHLEQAGIAIIQIDEPALREGLPLKRRDWDAYLDWAVRAFKIASCGVSDDTQVHTHMCYAEFNDIVPAIAALDADVITIESSRSAMEVLDGFAVFRYLNDIGPGVYDIHSARVPSVDDMVTVLDRASQAFPSERLWVNPDCGLKTRSWTETEAALRNLVEAARRMRARIAVQVLPISA